MSETAHRTNDSAPGGERHRQFTCAKCDHVNPHEAALCSNCGSHLFLKCKECGHVNQRTSPSCTECGHRMRRSWWDRKVAPKLRAPRRPITPVQILLLVIAIPVAFKVILFLSAGKLPASGP